MSKVNALSAIQFNNAKKFFLDGLEHLSNNRLELAEKSFTSSLEILPDRLSTLTNLIATLIRLNKFKIVADLIENTLHLYPKDEVTLFHKSNLLAINKEYDKSIIILEEIITINPENLEANFNAGLMYLQLSDYESSIQKFNKVIYLSPNHHEAYNNKGVALLSLDRRDEAIIEFNNAIAVNEGFSEAYSNLGNALQDCDQLIDSIIYYKKAISIDPLIPEVHFNLGRALFGINDFQAALSSFNMAISIKHDYVKAHVLHGNVLHKLKDFSGAINSYNKATSFEPNFTEALFNHGVTLQAMNLHDKAIIYYERVITIKPDFIDAYNNCADAYFNMNLLDKAISFYEKGFELCPNYNFLYGNLIHSRMSCCNWKYFDDIYPKLLSLLSDGVLASTPFPILSVIDKPQIHKDIAQSYVNFVYPQRLDLITPLIQKHSKKIRIGYFSADFRNHPVSYLSAELFELHNRNSFEIIAFSSSPTENNSFRDRLECAFDKFITTYDMSDIEIAKLSRELGIDIAVDLGGHTINNRFGVFSYRSAPIQISYIGYLGTTGASYIDYLVADDNIVPSDFKDKYTEKIVYLPCYQVNDSQKKPSSKIFTKSDLLIPESGFIFCSFNNAYKITPFTFSIWMRILSAVDGSFICLLADSELIANNLRAEAKARGISSDRLIFVPRIDYRDYLSRFSLFDLFLDTFPYNAGATASDALWAGLPVLTCMGESFASRVAASLLKAIDLPELITHSQQEYEAKAIELATNPVLLKATKDKLAANKLTKPLFDTKLFTKHLESAYSSIHQRHQDGLPPDHIYINN